MKKKNNFSIDAWHGYNVDVDRRVIWLGSETTDVNGDESGCDSLMAERFIKNMYLLSQSNKAITVLMNNIGGDEYHCMAIYDAIKSSPAKVAIMVFGHAMSAGSIILQAADLRIMMPNAVQMVHYGTWGTYTHAKTAQKHAAEGQRFDSWMEQLYLSRMREVDKKIKLSRVQKMLDHDTYLTAEESVALGLADQVYGKSK
jgi:ATP-dependent protease ClpP protease subunit